jgi:hypothetical protein
MVKTPVDSMTMSTPRSPQGMRAGSRSAVIAIFSPSTYMKSSSALTSLGKTRITESYFSR